MTKDTSSHFLFGYRGESDPTSVSEYSRAFKELEGVSRTFPVNASSEIDISHMEDDMPHTIMVSASREAFRAHPLPVPVPGSKHCCRSESHFAMSYSQVVVPKTEYKDEFKAKQATPSTERMSARSDRCHGGLLPVECDHTDYTSEMKRSYVTLPANVSRVSCMESASKLRGSHFTIGSLSESPNPRVVSTSHSHYGKRAGLRGTSRNDPEIVSLREELSKSHFSLCD